MNDDTVCLPNRVAPIADKPRSHRFGVCPTGRGLKTKQVGYQAASRAFDLAFDLKRPVKPRWPEFDVDLQGNRHGCRFSRAGPGMALRGGPPNQCRIPGMPSTSEGPSGGARAFCLLLRFSKVRRRKGATIVSEQTNNGYVLSTDRKLRTVRYSSLCKSGGIVISPNGSGRLPSPAWY